MQYTQLNSLLFFILILFSSLCTTAACITTPLGDRSITIKSESDNTQLIILGHYHRNYSALDKFEELVTDAASASGDRVELKKKLEAIKSWNDGDMARYYNEVSKDTYAEIIKLIKEQKIDLLGMEAPFVAATSRLAAIQKMSDLYAKLVREAYGSRYVAENLEKDLLAMVGADWYFAATTQGQHKIEGVESSLLEHRFGKNHNVISDALTQLSKAKTSENKETVEIIIRILASTSRGNPQVLALAKAKLSPNLIELVERAAKARKEFDDDYFRRDEWMLTSMKSRTDKAGLLIVGQNHLATIKENAGAFCGTKKLTRPSPGLTSPATP